LPLARGGDVGRRTIMPKQNAAKCGIIYGVQPTISRCQHTGEWDERREREMEKKRERTLYVNNKIQFIIVLNSRLNTLLNINRI